jgi:hypothetical protein
MWNSLLVFSVGAFISGLVLIPLAIRYVKPLVSPYAKADFERRLLASFVDLWVMVACYAALVHYSATLAAFISPLYLAIRDGLFGGQSFGKLMVGLVTIRLETGQPVKIGGSLRRNFLFAIPGTNVAAFFFEARQIHVDEQGMRLGDRLAGTQVVHGKEAIDLLKSVADVARWVVGKIRGLTLPAKIPRSTRMVRRTIRVLHRPHNHHMQRTSRSVARFARRKLRSASARR